ncbi:hypothetical protein [Bacteriovorax sp. Seq25_V]|uniref:hypothetical protein n=1 Tax=Bacteriovorax sp. Seq25_V TaxID=1201288 RepID=UPI000556CE81|nr:hypothetical protein [Bacteriovorax sp. Seq25_V]
MNIYLIITVLFIISLGVALIYPLFFSRPNIQTNLRIKQRAIYKSEMSSLVKSALWAISLLLISCFFGSVTIDYSKEFYSILIIAVTILAVIL